MSIGTVAATINMDAVAVGVIGISMFCFGVQMVFPLN